MKEKDEVLILKEDIVEDIFFHNDVKIAVINNKVFKNISEDVVILAKLVMDENGDEFIELLTDEEYDSAFKKYEKLLEEIDNLESEGNE